MDEMAMTSTQSTVLNYDENIYFITILQNPRNGRRQKTIYFHYRDKGKIKVFLLYETLEILNFKSLRKKKGHSNKMKRLFKFGLRKNVEFSKVKFC